MIDREKVAKAIEEAQFVAYSLRLTRLVDGVSVYTLHYEDGTPPLEFGSHEEAHEHIADKKRMSAADAAIAAVTGSRGYHGDLAAQPQAVPAFATMTKQNFIRAGILSFKEHELREIFETLLSLTDPNRTGAA